MMAEEVSRDHTNLLKMSLAVEESRIYWENFDPGIPQNRLAPIAFENRWFGDKSMPRVRTILADFKNRYNAFPQALEVLRCRRPQRLFDRRNLCHWHMQLSDPIYRDFTGTFLTERRLHSWPSIDRNVVMRWLQDRVGDRWAVATRKKIAQSLMTSAAEAGLCTPEKQQRALFYPPVSDTSLTYLLYLLRQTRFNGTLLSNSYLLSVGLSDGFLEKRLLRLKEIRFNRMGELTSFEWQYADLRSWAQENRFSNRGDES